jgi:hypothetical protein
MSLRQLAARLDKDIDYKLDKTALAKIETGDRRVQVDDLIALGLALNVSPLMLLCSKSEDAVVRIGNVAMAPAHFRSWVRGRVPMPTGSEPILESERAYFAEVSDGEWRARDRFPSLLPLSREAENLEVVVASIDALELAKRESSEVFARQWKRLRDAMRRVMNEMKAEVEDGSR